MGSTAQEEDGAQLQPIAMVSVPLIESSRTKWSTHTAELNAIVQGCKRLATMIDGQPITQKRTIATYNSRSRIMLL